MTPKVNRRFHLKVNGKFSAMLRSHFNEDGGALFKGPLPLGVKHNRNSLI